MAFNLIRNSRVFFTTNVDSYGTVAASGFLPANTRELQVLEGFSFSQKTSQDTVTLNESGAAPARGQRSFNKSLDPVDFSFSTYIRPADGGTNITAEEGVLWNALFAADAIGGAAPAWTEAITKATATTANSNHHQLQKFGMIIVTDTTTFVIDNCVLNTATIDFGIDAIAMIAWVGQGGTLRQIVTPGIATTATEVTFTNTLAGTAKVKNTAAPYIANKLSTVTFDDGINGSGTLNYVVPITGGSLAITNNVSYLTPANIGVVNKPATYFTGTRAITGTLNAYLRSGASGTSNLDTASLLSTMLSTSGTDVNPSYQVLISIGGATNTTRVDLKMPAVVLTIPTIDAQAIISTAINFTAQGSADTGNAFDITNANELTVEYYAINAA